MPVSGAANIVFVRDNLGNNFLVDTGSMARYDVGAVGSAAYQSAVGLYGNPQDNITSMSYEWQARQRAWAAANGVDQSSNAIYLDTGIGFTRGGPAEEFLASQPSGAVDAADVSSQDAFAVLEQQLKEMGLPISAGAIQDLLVTAPSEEQFWLWLREQDEFQSRFSGIFDLQNRGEQLVPGGSLAQQVRGFLEYENTVSGLLDQTGLSSSVLRGGRTVTDVVNDALAGGISANEFEFRIGTVFRQVDDAPAEVRAFLDEMFADTNLSGDQALAAFLLDPSMSEDDLLQAAQTATVGGAGMSFGFNLTGDQAQQLQRQTGITQFGQAAQGFGQAAQFRPLTIETVSERQDLTDFDAVQAAFGTNATADEVMRKRLENRQAKFAGGGGAAMSQGGVFGLGSANS